MSQLPDEQRFPMFGLTRNHLKDAGLGAEQIVMLTDEDMQRIATHAGELLLANDAFAGAIIFAAWNRILGTTLYAEDTTESEAGKHTSYVCCCMDDNTSVEVAGLIGNFRFSWLRAKHPMLVNYIHVEVPKKRLPEFRQFAAKYRLRMICIDELHEVAVCLADLDNQRFEQIKADGGQLY